MNTILRNALSKHWVRFQPKCLFILMGAFSLKCLFKAIPDDIPITLWKSLKNSLSAVLAKIFTMMINENYIPCSWKIGIVTFIYEYKGKESKSYHPITNTSTISMVFKK